MGLLLAFLLAASSAGTTGGPPPAFVTADGAQKRMATGSFCWADRCVDKAGMPKGPTVRLDPGETVRFELGFDPRSVRLYTGERPRGVRLEGRRPVYEATGGEDYLSLFARPRGGGDVSYLATVR